jgi:hypothetical protein
VTLKRSTELTVIQQVQSHQFSSLNIKVIKVMKSFNKIVVILCVVCQIQGKVMLNPRDLVIPQYISSLVRLATVEDPSRNHDVALIRLEMGKKSEVLDDIASVLLKQNPENAVLIHESYKPIKQHRVHYPSFIVIVSNMYDVVSKII